MDSERFAHLVQTLVNTPSRRAVMRGLSALVAGSAVAALFGAETEAAKPHRHKRKAHRGKDHERVQDERKKKKKKKKEEEAPATTTSGTPSPCAACANPTPICVNDTCVACTSSTQCPARTLCDEGSCQACTVCASGCLYPNVESALLDPAGPTVVRLCADTYQPLTINRAVTLIGAGNGNGSGDTVFNGGNDGRVLNITTFSTVTLRNLRITGGDTADVDSDEGRGGGIWNGAQLTLSDCVITGNTGSWGGGMHNVSEAQLTRCTVSDNHAMSDEAAGVGGGISNFGRLTLVDSLVTMNKAGAGGGIVNDHGVITLDDSIVSKNTAEQGGGVYNTDAKVTLINGGSITDNDAAPEGGMGGGIFNDDGVVDASGGSITGNRPDDCAGVCP